MNLRGSGGHGRGWKEVWGELYNYILILRIGKKKDKARKSCCDMNKPKRHFAKWHKPDIDIDSTWHHLYVCSKNLIENVADYGASWKESNRWRDGVWWSTSIKSVIWWINPGTINILCLIRMYYCCMTLFLGRCRQTSALQVGNRRQAQLGDQFHQGYF